MPKKLGETKCPLPCCGREGAEVMEGDKGSPYIRCDACGSMIRTMTRGVKDWMRSLVNKPPEAPEPERIERPKPAPAAPKKRGALSFLTGSDD